VIYDRKSVTRDCKFAVKTVFYRQEKSLYFGVFLEIQALSFWQGQKDLKLLYPASIFANISGIISSVK